MKIFAIADLHLPGGDSKPMDVFGSQWENHFERICEDWHARVQAEDVVLIPGDTSWAMQLDAALPDLLQIGALPGRKILLRGNHDFWWSSLSRLRAALPEQFYALQNDAMLLSGVLFAGTRAGYAPADGGDRAGSKNLRARSAAVKPIVEGRQKVVEGSADCGDAPLSSLFGAWGADGVNATVERIRRALRGIRAPAWGEHCPGLLRNARKCALINWFPAMRLTLHCTKLHTR